MDKNSVLFALLLCLCLAACSNARTEQPVQKTSSEAGSIAKEDSLGCKSVVSRKDIAR